MAQAAAAGPDLPTSLEGIREAMAAANPQLYRHVALYLQVLRAVLPDRVRQACFHLATQVHAQRYLRLSAAERLALHRRLEQRVARCSSLLTVEQLNVLAAELAREEQQRQQQRQQELLQELLQRAETGDSEDQEPDDTASGPAPSGLAPDGETGADLPPGSVRLASSPPLTGGSFAWPMPPRPAPSRADLLLEDLLQAAADSTADSTGARHSADSDESDQYADSADSADSGADTDGPRARDKQARDKQYDEQYDEHDNDRYDERYDEYGATDPDPGAAPAPQPGEPAAADAARSRPGQGLDAAAAADDQAGDADRLQEALAEAGGMAALLDPAALAALIAAAHPAAGATATARLGSAPPAASPDPGASPPLERAQPADSPGLLPRDPLLLLQWLDGVERALTRRLRNLSQAINGDLLRCGLSRGLLPVSLLEAVLHGQVETLASPANVLRLQLPFGLKPGAPPLQALAILLRRVDLEMEEPRLRTCRRRLQQHRQEVRRMAHQYRRLQRRLQAHEAERLWLQDIQRIRATPD